MGLTAPELHPADLRDLLDQKVPNWRSVEPPELWSKLDQAFGSVSRPNKNKIQGLRTLLAQPETVLDDWRVFEKVCLALQGSAPNFLYVEPLSYSELIGGATLIRQLLGKEIVFGDNLLRYAAAVAAGRGAARLLPPLEAGNIYLHEPLGNPSVLADAAVYAALLQRS